MVATALPSVPWVRKAATREKPTAQKRYPLGHKRVPDRLESQLRAQVGEGRHQLAAEAVGIKKARPPIGAGGDKMQMVETIVMALPHCTILAQSVAHIVQYAMNAPPAMVVKKSFTMRWVSFVRLSVVLLFALLVPAGISPSQTISPNLLNERWAAKWIVCQGVRPREFSVCRFRKIFNLEATPKTFVIHASGDSRYEMFVNGERVLEGPARGDLFHWRYETLDIAPHLRAGRNVLATVVWNFADQAPMAQMSNETGFILQGADEAAVNTGAGWKGASDASISMIPVGAKTHHVYYTVVGPGERVDGEKYPWGWASLDFDDSAWPPAEVIGPGGPRGIQDSPSRWMLVPRNIPLMEEKLQRLARVVRAEGVSVPPDFVAGRAPVTVPANTHATILFDQSFETTAYPELVVSGGHSASITVTYAESLWKDGRKGNRNATEGKTILGYDDEFIADGGAHRLFRPFWWRTYRYVQLDIATQNEPLTLEDFRGQFTAYPFAARARFKSDDAELEKIWQVGWRTARLCAHETYIDCPYYEQLQYAGDTRIQVLISLYMTGDDRLAKNAIALLDASRLSDGLTQSRYPSRLPQVIPTFSLFWIGMMHDLWWYRGDNAFLRAYLPGMRGVLDWFRARLAPSGLLGKIGWWPFVDWASDFNYGDPPQEADGQSSILSLQFAQALRDAADLEATLGRPVNAERDRALAAKITAAVYKSCWTPARGLLADTPAKRHFSQHANVWGVLTGAIPPGEQRAVMEKVLTDPSLTQATYYFRFYLFRAMTKAGLGDEYIAQLAPWRAMLARGLTTFAERPPPTRSDCHAWSAHPNVGLLAIVAGIESAAPGFAKVAIAPHLGPLTELSATMPHPLGTIAVSYHRTVHGISAEITLPKNLSGTFLWHGKTAALSSGKQQISF